MSIGFFKDLGAIVAADIGAKVAMNYGALETLSAYVDKETVSYALAIITAAEIANLGYKAFMSSVDGYLAANGLK